MICCSYRRRRRRKAVREIWCSHGGNYEDYWDVTREDGGSISLRNAAAHKTQGITTHKNTISSSAPRKHKVSHYNYFGAQWNHLGVSSFSGMCFGELPSEVVDWALWRASVKCPCARHEGSGLFRRRQKPFTTVGIEPR